MSITMTLRQALQHQRHSRRMLNNIAATSHSYRLVYVTGQYAMVGHLRATTSGM